MALLLACCVSPCAGSGHADDEALTGGRFHDLLGECVQPIECQETPDLGKEARRVAQRYRHGPRWHFESLL
jgi:hypothetical protein